MTERLEGYPDPGPDDFVPDHPANPVEAIFQAVGAASMCWENIEGAGVFREDKALQVANGLIAYLRENPL